MKTPFSTWFLSFVLGLASNQFEIDLRDNISISLRIHDIPTEQDIYVEYNNIQNIFGRDYVSLNSWSWPYIVSCRFSNFAEMQLIGRSLVILPSMIDNRWDKYTLAVRTIQRKYMTNFGELRTTKRTSTAIHDWIMRRRRRSRSNSTNFEHSPQEAADVRSAKTVTDCLINSKINVNNQRLWGINYWLHVSNLMICESILVNDGTCEKIESKKWTNNYQHKQKNVVLNKMTSQNMRQHLILFLKNHLTSYPTCFLWRQVSLKLSAVLLGLYRFCHILVISTRDPNPRDCAISKQRSHFLHPRLERSW